MNVSFTPLHLNVRIVSISRIIDLHQFAAFASHSTRDVLLPWNILKLHFRDEVFGQETGACRSWICWKGAAVRTTDIGSICLFTFGFHKAIFEPTGLRWFWNLFILKKYGFPSGQLTYDVRLEIMLRPFINQHIIFTGECTHYISHGRPARGWRPEPNGVCVRLPQQLIQRGLCQVLLDTRRQEMLWRWSCLFVGDWKQTKGCSDELRVCIGFTALEMAEFTHVWLSILMVLDWLPSLVWDGPNPPTTFSDWIGL